MAVTPSRSGLVWWADFGCSSPVIYRAPLTVPNESSRGRSLCKIEHTGSLVLSGPAVPVLAEVVAGEGYQIQSTL